MLEIRPQRGRLENGSGTSVERVCGLCLGHNTPIGEIGVLFVENQQNTFVNGCRMRQREDGMEWKIKKLAI